MIQLVALLAFASSPEPADVGPLVRSLWLVQRYGTSEARNPANDARVKGALAKALSKDGVITAPELAGFMKPETFREIAGADGSIESADVVRALAASSPESRGRIHPRLRAHADYLSTTFDLIDEPHRLAGEKLARWIAGNHQPGKPLHVIVVCTGNSRRSVLGASMGNLAAAYYGMPEIQFHSGGTAPTALNSRTARTMKEIGFQVEPTGKEAPRGDAKTANPVFRISWGESLEALEFSKHYGDPANPRDGFAALMVCGEADAECPFVKGAAIRVSMPYLDPKIYDDGAYEAAKYSERRDDIGRLMLSVMVQARGEMSGKNPGKD